MEATIIEFCDQNDIKYISSELVGKLRNVTFITTECGHQKTALWTNIKNFRGTKKCSECDERVMTYEKLVKLFKDNDCILITSKEEYEKIQTDKDKIHYVAQCGHDKHIILSHFKNDRQGRK